MADTSTHRTTHTQLAARRGPQGHTQHDGEGARSATMGITSLATGALGAVAGVIPLMGIVALVLAGVAFATGVPSMRDGARSPGYRYARIGIVLAVIAVLLGAINLAIQLDLFSYFTTGDPVPE